MKSTFKVDCFALTLVLGFSTVACSGNSGGGDSGDNVKNAKELKKYLDSQPANSPDEPIKIAINAKNLTFRKIAEAITSSGKYVNLDLSGSVTSIGDYAFSDCSVLTGVTFEGTIASANLKSDNSFPGDLRATYIAIGGGIGTYTRPNGKDTWTKQSSRPNSETDFSVGLTVDGRGVVITEYKGKTTSVRIPATIQGFPVREIGEKAFWNNSYEEFDPATLKWVTPDNVNRRITSVFIPDGVTTIGSQAFYRCENLYIISLPDSLASIGNSVFAGCSALNSINLPVGLKKIGDEAFNSSGLTSISLPVGLTTIPYGVFAYTKLRSVTIAEGVIEIGEYAFNECTNLTSVSLPSTIRKIGRFAFSSCSSLASINIPETVTKIMFVDEYGSGNKAFEGCHKLNLESQASLRRVGYTGSF